MGELKSAATKSIWHAKNSYWMLQNNAGYVYWWWHFQYQDVNRDLLPEATTILLPSIRFLKNHASHLVFSLPFSFFCLVKRYSNFFIVNCHLKAETGITKEDNAELIHYRNNWSIAKSTIHRKREREREKDSGQLEIIEMSSERPDKIAKQMFYVGLCGLPWLWAVNIMYFWDSVYGRLPCFGDSPNKSDNDENAEDTGILGLMEGSNDEDDGDQNGKFCLLKFRKRFMRCMLRHFNLPFMTAPSFSRDFFHQSLFQM